MKRHLQITGWIALLLAQRNVLTVRATELARRRVLDKEGARNNNLSKTWWQSTWEKVNQLNYLGETPQSIHDERHLGAFSDTGAEVFLISFPDNADDIDLDNLNITKITKQNGINGDPSNRYVWSSALDNDDNLYIGTLNQNIYPWNLTNSLLSITRAPIFKLWDAIVDTFLRQWSGTPFFTSDGAEIYYYYNGKFELVFEAPEEHMGLRKMVNYRGDIYAGSSNGPNGPYDGRAYDFKFYEEGDGAKIFTNAGGYFQQLDDEGNLDSYDKSVRSMCVSSYSDRLFVGTETHECAKILVYEPAAPGVSSWKRVELEGDDCTLSVSDCFDLGGGKMLFGTWASFSYGLYIVDETDGDSLTKINTPNLLFHVSFGVMELRVFKGYLYVGIIGFVNGFALIKTSIANDLTNLKRSDWDIITKNGFAKEQRKQLGGRIGGNEYPWTSAEINGIYFLGTIALTSRGISLQAGVDKLSPQAQLWATIDGETWQAISSEVFDDPPFMYGFRSMQATSDQKSLYIGSAANMYAPEFG